MPVPPARAKKHWRILGGPWGSFDIAVARMREAKMLKPRGSFRIRRTGSFWVLEEVI